jgi:hypothetical protein
LLSTIRTGGSPTLRGNASPCSLSARYGALILVPEDDHLVNDLGIKGLGELGNVGTNAAVANAVYHATGVRIRELPIRLEKLLNAPSVTL